MRLPDWFSFLILIFAAYRTWRLLAEDSILDWPRRRLLRLGDEWEKEGDPVPIEYRAKLGEFITCPACFGFWISLGWFLAWYWFGSDALWVAMPLAISAGVIFVRSTLDPPED